MHTIEDYRNAPSGIGPLADQWKDKPHQLLIELCDWRERSEVKGVVTCVYCGHEYPDGTPTAKHKLLTDRIAKCEKHPMRAVIQQRDELLDAIDHALVWLNKPYNVLGARQILLEAYSKGKQ